MSSIAQKCKVNGCNGIGKLDKKTNKLYLIKGYCQRHYAQVSKKGYVYTSRGDAREAIIDGDIAKIPLGVGAKLGYAIVDKEDAWVDKYKWHIRSGYAITSYSPGVGHLSMHRIINKTEPGMFTDHINRNRLDNRKSNLRSVTSSQNHRNARIYGCSGYKGVQYLKSKNVWIATIKGVASKRFKSKECAAVYYNRLAKEVYGEYAYLNIIKE